MGFTAGGLGTFQEGFQVGAVAGALAGGIALHGSSGGLLDFSNEMIYRTSLGTVKRSLLPLTSGANTFLTTIGIGAYVYNQYKKPCAEGEDFDWKKGSCQPSSISVPIPTGGN